MRLALTGSLLPKGQSIPMWVTVLQMAEAWSTPPWDITGHPGSVRWMARWKFYNEQVARVLEEARNEK